MADDGMIYYLEPDLKYNMPDTGWDVNLSIVKQLDDRAREVRKRLDHTREKASPRPASWSSAERSRDDHGRTEALAIRIADLTDHLNQLNLEIAAQSIILSLWMCDHITLDNGGAKTRVLLRYRYCDLLSFRQISQKMDGLMSEDAVKKEIHRTLKRLNLSG